MDPISEADANGNGGNLMGRWAATSYILGCVIGSGIFITPTGILNNVQSVGASLLIWLASGLITILGALCYLELGTSIRKSGCDFAYLCHMRWVGLAFAFMTCSCIFMGPGSLAIQAETFTEYFVRGFKLEFCDPFVKSAVHKLITFSVLLPLFFLNCFSINGVVSRFQIISMIAKMAACAIIVVSGILFWVTQGAHSNNFAQPFANSNFEPGKVVLALFSGLFSYGGWDILNTGIEDIAHPHRTMPFAIIAGMAIVILLYMTMNVSYFAVLTVTEMRTSNAIAMTFSERVFHGYLQYLMPFLVCIVLIGSLNATLFGGSRMLWSIARDGYFPSFISCINRQHGSPRAALFIFVVLAMLFSFLGDLDELIGYVEFTNWVVRCCTMVALFCIRFGHRADLIHPEALRVPLVLPIVYFFVCLSLVVVTVVRNFKSAMIGLSFQAFGLFVYLVFIWPPAISRFSNYRNVAHRINSKMSAVAQIVFDGAIEVKDRRQNEDGLFSLMTDGDNDHLSSTHKANSTSSSRRRPRTRRYLKDGKKVYPMEK
ncbi:hypothetical protein niasHS_004108 [Heterodera schachtii]|uniref:Amino acid transporter n=2 Tax=Heterodera TaxID=34509 RepID=A0ABD2JUN5_HETSC